LVVRAQESLDMYEQHDIESGIRSLMSGVGLDSDSGELEGSYSNEWSESAAGAVPAAAWPSGSADSSGPGAGDEDGSSSDGSNSSGPRFAAPMFPGGSSRSSSVPKSASYGLPAGAFGPGSSLSGASRATSAAATAHSYGDARWQQQQQRQSSRSDSAANTFETVIMDAQRSRYHDDFVQLRCLGRGGFGKVYEVRNKLDGRPYAVKLIKIKGEITAEKTLREIKTLANLDHPNIVRYYSSWLEVTHLRRRSPGSRRDQRSASPLICPPRAPVRASSCGQRRLAWAGAASDQQASTSADDDDEDTAELTSEWHTVDSVVSLDMLATSPQSLGDIQFEGVGADAIGCLDELSSESGSSWAAFNGGMVFGDRIDSGEAAVLAEVSIGHTNETYEQRRETESNIVFEHSSDAAEVAAGCDAGCCAREPAATSRSCPALGLVRSPEGSVRSDDDSSDHPADRVVERVEPISINTAEQRADAPDEGYAGMRHRRLRSLNVNNGAIYATGTTGASANPRPMSVLETQSGQPRSLPSQVLAGLEVAQSVVAETTLFVQMQLCQTTLQEFLSQRNERIARGKQRSVGGGGRDDAGQKCGGQDDPAWCGLPAQELLIDPVMNVRLFRAIVEGVKYFHNRGVIHRDLKGANVFLDIVYADSGGNPISRGGSGIGRPTSSASALTSRDRLSALSPLSPPVLGALHGFGGVHADAWDAIDGGNLKGRPAADGRFGMPAATGPSDPASGRHVDWDAVFNSMVANRSISSGKAGTTTAGAGPKPDGQPASASARGPAALSGCATEDEQPPMVAFIPRIGDFGLATKATLGAPTADDEGSFADGDGSAKCSPGSGPEQLQEAPRQSQRKAGGPCSIRRTSNVGTITYAAPEQLRDRATGYSEKADIYSLGIIFFELYYPFATAMERAAVIKDLRQGVFPAQFVQMWPKEAAFILHLMDADPDKRPSAKEILSLDLIDVPTLESAQLKREVLILKQQLRAANQRNEELGLRVRELERIVDMSL
ncbi:hypothetical protein LPJ61_005330, partial [Coemansia biformis]